MSLPAGSRPLVRPAAGRAIGEVAFWAVPALIVLLVYFSPRHIVSARTLLTGLAGLCLVILAARRPDLSLLGLVIFLPFQGLLLARLWASGVPASVVGHMGAWKEALALGVILAGLRNAVAHRHRLDAVDRLALAFVLLCALYAAFQPAIVPGSPAASNIRLLGFRETAGFVLLLLGARHAPLPAGFAERIARAIFLTGVVVSAIGIFDWLDFRAWNSFVVHTMRYPDYQVAVLHSQPANPSNIGVFGVVGGVQTRRIGSVFLSSLSLGWYLILPFAVGFERVVRRSASLPYVAGTVVIGLVLLRTETRSAIIAALIVTLLALAPAAGRPRHWRAHVAVVLALIAVLAIPAALTTGALRRIEAAERSGDTSTAGHLSGLRSGLDTLSKHLLGQGLGTGAGTGQRFNVTHDVIPENNYLEVGDELGLIAMLLFVALTLALLGTLRRSARRHRTPLSASAWAACAGLAVAAYFLQPWGDFAVAWTFWGAAGAVLCVAPPRPFPLGASVQDGAGPARRPTARRSRGRAGRPLASPPQSAPS